MEKSVYMGTDCRKCAISELTNNIQIDNQSAIGKLMEPQQESPESELASSETGSLHVLLEQVREVLIDC